MSARRLLGIGRDAAGHVAPVFAAPDRVVDALGHHRAVVEASRRGGFLPAPLDMPAHDPVMLAARISERRQTLAAALDAAGDMVEIGVRVTPVVLISDQPVVASGRGFLRQASARFASATAARIAVEEILDRIAAQAQALEHRRLPDENGAARLALKARRADAPALAAEIESLAREDVAVSVSGPWPLYSFGAAAYLSEGGAA
ncbi:MAG: GvpL/GvpF family gas vesicle protein [Beijerinckiaceae bacterium]